MRLQPFFLLPEAASDFLYDDDVGDDTETPPSAEDNRVNFNDVVLS